MDGAWILNFDSTASSMFYGNTSSLIYLVLIMFSYFHFVYYIYDDVIYSSALD